MFRKIKTDNFYLYSTEVENFFIADFMIKAPGEYVKAYLLALMFAQLRVAADSQSIKMRLGMSDDQIDECWTYWAELGIIRRVNNENGDSYDVEFVNLRELIGKGTVSSESHVESVLDDKELAKLYKDIQKATGRMIEGREMKEVVAWIQDYGINPDLILYCYRYCASRRKSTAYRYVATVLRDWSSKDLKTVDDVEAFLNESDNRFSIYKSVFKELGFSRNPTAEEKRMMDDWIDNSMFSLDEILNACKQTTAIPNPNLKYVDAVLRNTRASSKKGSSDTENTAVKINRLYERLRKENEEKTARNRKAVFSKIPRIENIMTELGAESLRRTQAMLRRDMASADLSRKKIDSLLSERAELLKAAGFSENAVDAVYSCSRCKDTGLTSDGRPCQCYAEMLERVNAEN